MGTISFDTETGAVTHLTPGARIDGTVAARIAAHLLPGLSPTEVERLYTDAMTTDTDPMPYGVRTRVEHRTASLTGLVMDRRETAGELHSVLVKWDNHPGGAEWYSPRELAPITPMEQP